MPEGLRRRWFTVRIEKEMVCRKDREVGGLRVGYRIRWLKGRIKKENVYWNNREVDGLYVRER